ncbi:hypothetical protein SCLCIDRAFT_1222432 [Scleroderma citrinum Foug A]|uniref:Uncharacterized protein n=1 Tax=Scleroderma citrinum Foug A TaxID=1036808 RepID=A0A0C3DCT6_9AGAM|nr:hypothetical protein SCLCIDRAFT_1222432 [Scleroderma citrinum Foug A]
MARKRPTKTNCEFPYWKLDFLPGQADTRRTECALETMNLLALLRIMFGFTAGSHDALSALASTPCQCSFN